MGTDALTTTGSRTTASAARAWIVSTDHAGQEARDVAAALVHAGIDATICSAGDLTVLPFGEADMAVLTKGPAVEHLRMRLRSRGIAFTGPGVIGHGSATNPAMMRRVASAHRVPSTPFLSVRDLAHRTTISAFVVTHGPVVDVRSAFPDGRVTTVRVNGVDEVEDTLLHHSIAGAHSHSLTPHPDRVMVTAACVGKRDGVDHLALMEPSAKDLTAVATAQHEQIEHWCPARITAASAAMVRDAAAKLYDGLGLGGVATFAFALAADGVPHIHDVDPMPSLSRTGAVARMAEVAGWTYERLVRQHVEHGSTQRP